MFGIFSNAARQVVNLYHSVYNRVANQLSSLTKPPQPQSRQLGSVSFAVTHQLNKGQAASQAVITVFTDGKLNASVYNEIGKAGVKIIQDLLNPIRRTGKLQDSFKYSIDTANQSVTIFSDSPQAAGIQNGIRRVGSVQDLRDWMRLKPEFQQLSAKEFRDVSWRIKRHIELGRPPGPKSVLRRIQPVGERRYDYVAQATKQLEQELENMFAQIGSQIP